MPFKAIKDPGCPTQQEIDHHNIMHLPPRSWCPVCIEARGKEDPHFTKKEKEERDKPTVGFDYKTLGQAESPEEKETVLIIRNAQTLYGFSHVVDQKGPGDDWILDKVLKDIERL